MITEEPRTSRTEFKYGYKLRGTVWHYSGAGETTAVLYPDHAGQKVVPPQRMLNSRNQKRIPSWEGRGTIVEKVAVVALS